MHSQPSWNPSDKPGSFLAWGDWLHDESKDIMLKDKTHGQMIFLFNDDGICSINPVPPETDSSHIAEGIREAIREHNLYGVILIAEAWTYFPKSPKDHTTSQLMDGEMRVEDLDVGDKTEVLMVRMESREGVHLTWVDEILRDGEKVSLGREMGLKRKSALKWEGWFE